MRFDKGFLKLSEENKYKFIEKNPEYILCLDDSLMELDSLNKNSLMYKLKLTALKNAGYLINDFEKYNLSINQELADVAINSDPEVIKYIDEKYLNIKNIHSAVKKDISIIAYIPIELMDENMLAYCNRCIRRTIRTNEKFFLKLPSEMQELNFSATNAFTYKKNVNLLQLSTDQLNLNGGKVMFKVARKDPAIILKMQRDAWRKTLVLTMVSKMPEIFSELPKIYRENVTVQYVTYKTLKLQRKSGLIPMLFSEEERNKASKKYKAMLRIKEAKEKKKTALKQKEKLEKALD